MKEQNKVAVMNQDINNFVLCFVLMFNNQQNFLILMILK